MTPLQGAVLGLVQGLTEFLPISSSGHLILAQQLLEADVGNEGVFFEVIVHLATLLAVIVVFRQDAWLLVCGAWGLLRGIGRGPRRWMASRPERTVLLTCVGTIPVVVVGYLAKDMLGAIADDPRLGPLVTGWCLLATAGILTATLRAPESKKSILLRVALLVGIGQALAILPGISRSGTTIAVGLLLGLERSLAARLSFLLAIPAILGAGILEAKGLVTGEAEIPSALLAYGVAFVTAFASGLGALVLLLKVVRAGRLAWFAPYCAIVGVIAIVWTLMTPA